jgi:Na+/glutamate symporter
VFKPLPFLLAFTLFTLKPGELVELVVAVIHILELQVEEGHLFKVILLLFPDKL